MGIGGQIGVSGIIRQQVNWTSNVEGPIGNGNVLTDWNTK